MSGIALIIVFVLAIIVMIVAISKFKVHPFLAIMGVSLILAMIAGIPFVDTVKLDGTKVYGILSVLIQAFYHVEYLFDVPPESFNPPPKVMSGVIELKEKKDIPAMKSEKAFGFLLI